MIHLKTTCDTRRTKKDGTHPIVYRITVEGKSRDISSGLSCQKKHWDYHKQCLKQKTEKLKVLYQIVKDKELELLRRIRIFEDERPFIYDVQDVKEYLCKKDVRLISVKDFWLEEIERLHQSKHHSNANNYRSSLLGLDKVVNLNIRFEVINYSWLINTETMLKQRGLKVNTIFTYFKTLRALYNKAINMDIVNHAYYPFRRFNLKTENTPPRSLTLEEMREFFCYHPSSDSLKQAHDIGKLIFMLRGINYKDLAVLKTSSIKNNRLIYTRSKTKKVYSIKMFNELDSLLGNFKASSSKLLLNLISEDDLVNEFKLPDVIADKRKTLNKRLKLIGNEIGFSESLSTYVFRYSHANICRELGYSKDMISQSLGHQNGLRVTDSYLNDIDLNLIDEMNEKVCKSVIA